MQRPTGDDDLTHQCGETCKPSVPGTHIIYTYSVPSFCEAYQQPNLAVQPNRPTRYRLSHHSIVVMLPNHWCATSWHWNATTDFFVSMSARSGSRQYALVRPVIKPYENSQMAPSVLQRPPYPVLHRARVEVLSLINECENARIGERTHDEGVELGQGVLDAEDTLVHRHRLQTESVEIQTGSLDIAIPEL
jgi:hypothetical protein